jgi:hypothetical protein
MGASDPRERPHARLDWRAGRAPPEAREVLLSKDRHPSLHWGGEALWGTLHDVRHEDQTAGMEATDLRFALWPQFLLTARAITRQAPLWRLKTRRKKRYL